MNKPTKQQLDMVSDMAVLTMAGVFGVGAFVFALLDVALHFLASQSARLMQAINKWRENKEEGSVDYSNLSAVAIVVSLWSLVVAWFVYNLRTIDSDVTSVRSEVVEAAEDDSTAYEVHLKDMAESELEDSKDPGVPVS